jgi:hypothetical protein
MYKFIFMHDFIFNLIETAVSMIVQAPNIIAENGTNQVEQAVSAERGQLVTMHCNQCCCECITLPSPPLTPVILMTNAPEGNAGLANSPHTLHPVAVNSCMHKKSLKKQRDVLIYDQS